MSPASEPRSKEPVSDVQYHMIQYSIPFQLSLRRDKMLTRGKFHLYVASGCFSVSVSILFWNSKCRHRNIFPMQNDNGNQAFAEVRRSIAAALEQARFITEEQTRKFPVRPL